VLPVQFPASPIPPGAEHDYGIDARGSNYGRQGADHHANTDPTAAANKTSYNFKKKAQRVRVPPAHHYNYTVFLQLARVM